MSSFIEYSPRFIPHPAAFAYDAVSDRYIPGKPEWFGDIYGTSSRVYRSAIRWCPREGYTCREGAIDITDFAYSRCGYYEDDRGNAVDVMWHTRRPDLRIPGLVELFLSKNKLPFSYGDAEQRQLYRLIDVCAGPVAILLGGVGSFFPQGRRNVEEKPYSLGIKYSGVVNDVLYANSVWTSLLFSQIRLAMQLHLNRLYRKTHTLISIPTTRTYLASLAIKKSITTADRNKLRSILKKINSLIPEQIFQDNPGAYALNPVTWPVFSKETSARGKLPLLYQKTGEWDDIGTGFADWASSYIQEESAQKLYGKKTLSMLKEELGYCWSGTNFSKGHVYL